MSAQRAYRRPNPYKRAIAQAIELERTHDVLARIIGHSIPLPNRIVPEGHRKGMPRSERMRLPRALTLEAMNDMSFRTLDAIEELGSSILPTMGEVGGMVDDMLERSRESAFVEQSFRVARKGPSRVMDPEDRMTFDERNIRDILRAADMVTPAAAKPEVVRTEIRDHASITIDLMMDGLIDHHKVDRKALYAEVMELRARMGKRQSSLNLASPATRTNRTQILKSLGHAFPHAYLTLRGLSLNVDSIEMQAFTASSNGKAWTYRGAGGVNAKPTLTCQDGLHGEDVYDFPLRALRDVTADVRFHDAIVIDGVDRYGMNIPGEMQQTKITLRPGYTHIDPPTVSAAMRIKVKRPSDVRSGVPGRTAEHPDAGIIRQITGFLRDKGHTQRSRITRIEGKGLVLQISDKGTDNLLHRYLIQQDTITDGNNAIKARVDVIVDKLNTWMAAHPVGRGMMAPQSDKNADAVLMDGKTGNRTLRDNLKAMGAEILAQWDASDRIDTLLLDLLAKGPLKPDEVEMHHQEGMLLVRSTIVAKGILYRVERYDRVMGKVTHAIGTLDVDRALPASTVETLRDGSAAKLVPNLKEFGKSQVRKVSVRDGATSVVIRVGLVPKPE